MPSVVGVDLSTRAIDLVKLEEDTNRAEWVRCELAGRDAWERTLNIHAKLRMRLNDYGTSWWEDVYLVAIEAPYGRGQAGTNALLNRVVGAIAASLPAALRKPERCWIVAPHEWKHGLGLKPSRKPTWEDLEALAPDCKVTNRTDDLFFSSSEEAQNGRDAYCLAMWARNENARGIANALDAA